MDTAQGGVRTVSLVERAVELGLGYRQALDALLRGEIGKPVRRGTRWFVEVVTTPEELDDASRAQLVKDVVEGRAQVVRVGEDLLIRRKQS